MSKTWNPERALLDRIRQAYLLALESHQAETSALWSNIIPGRQNALHAAIMAGGEQYFAAFAEPSLTNLYLGVDVIHAEIVSGASPIPPLATSGHVRALLAVLAESLGAKPFWNPEGGSSFPNGEPRPNASPDDIAEALDIVLDGKISFPNPFLGEVGVKTNRGIASFRAVQALYQAARLKQLAELIDGGRCLEIGAGTGRTAYYGWQFGLRAYTIVDLPMALVGQACFLSATLGPNNIWLFGEEEPKSNEVIRLTPPHWLFSCGENFDIILNADSLTEMSRRYAERYIAFIVSRAKSFVSINHEANEFRVCDLLPGMFRFPYPLRNGYVEEWFFNAKFRWPTFDSV